MIRKTIAAIVSIAVVIGAFYVFRFIYGIQVANRIKAGITEQLERYEKELGRKTSYTITLPNLWGADTVVACRGYLEGSTKLTADLKNAGLSGHNAKEISQSPRWTEGAHLYFVRKNQVSYCWLHKIKLEKLKKDFVCCKAGKQIYIDLAFETFPYPPIDSNNMPVAKEWFLEAIR